MSKTLNMHEFKKPESKTYSGRDNGVEARKKLALNQLDKDNEKYDLIIPDGTYSITGSFFGGMLADSVKHLGEKKFREKYRICFRDGVISNEIQQDYEEGIYDALNGL